MERYIYNNLLKWKLNKERKPLLLQGARQVGKTYLVKYFGEQEYENLIYLNFEKNNEFKILFKANLSPKKIIENIGLYFGKKISENNTLIFFDEIQESPEALTSLKYFSEETPKYHIIGAGSLLGVSIGKKSSFPVGKLNFLEMHPLSFDEFLVALGESYLLETLKEKDNFESLPEIIHNKLIDIYKQYLFVGGMPEVVNSFVINKDIEEVREI